MHYLSQFKTLPQNNLIKYRDLRGTSGTSLNSNGALHLGVERTIIWKSAGLRKGIAPGRVGI